MRYVPVLPHVVWQIWEKQEFCHAERENRVALRPDGGRITSILWHIQDNLSLCHAKIAIYDDLEQNRVAHYEKINVYATKNLFS